MAGSAMGSSKTAALRVGLSVAEYEHRVASGMKWCTACKAWQARSAFPVDRTRGDGLRAKCLGFDRGRRQHDARHPERDLARAVVRRAVLAGNLPHPNTVPCADCGHSHLPGGRRHEYDHFKGYEPEHRLSVQPVCTICHADREKERRAA